MAFFVALRRTGPKWDPSLRLERQSDWKIHADLMDALVEEGFVVLGRPLADEHRVVLAVEADSEAAVRETLARDPWSQTHLLVDSVDRWTIRLDGRRVAAGCVERSAEAAHRASSFGAAPLAHFDDASTSGTGSSPSCSGPSSRPRRREDGRSRWPTRGGRRSRPDGDDHHPLHGRGVGRASNPAVTLAFSLRGLPWRHLPGYVVTSSPGPSRRVSSLGGLGKHGDLGATEPGAGVHGWQALLVELVLTVGLVGTVLGTPSKAQNVGPLASLGVAAVAAGLWATRHRPR